jgi:flagellar protein FliO/FliZ
MRLCALILLGLAPTTLAEDMAPAISPSSLFTGDYLLQVVGSLVVVILLLVAVLVLLKRFNGVSSSMSGDMRVISSIGVGQRERAVLLQVGEQQVLVGVGPGNVRTLHVFDEPALEPAAQKAPSFADVWKVATGKAETSS